MSFVTKSVVSGASASFLGNRQTLSNTAPRPTVLSRPASLAVTAASTQSEGVNLLLKGVTNVHNEVYQVSAAAAPPAPAPKTSTGPLDNINPAAIGAAAAVIAGIGGIKYVLDTPSRTYQTGGTVAKEYDAWTEEGILEHYWGEHIHLGYYNEEEMKAGYLKKDFIEAKKDFTMEMLKWADPPKDSKRILDCGCGIGGSSRILAREFPEAKVTGITLSPNQVKRGMQLAEEQGLPNVELKVMDALNQEHEDDTFDMVWACESGEHMPDKKAYVEEMIRVLKPGGVLVIATWCQREETPENPLTKEDKDNLQYLYDEWAHPYFISYQEYARMVDNTGVMAEIETDDWVKETIASWRHSVWVGVFSPWFVIMRPHVWYKTVRDIVCLERMHRAFDRGLMAYGMIKGRKAKSSKK